MGLARRTGNVRADEIAKRRERARSEPMDIQLGDRSLWGTSTYRVTGKSGGVYTVELGMDAGAAHSCTCHDFARNGLGTCKHVEAVHYWAHGGEDADSGASAAETAAAVEAPAPAGKAEAPTGERSVERLHRLVQDGNREAACRMLFGDGQEPGELDVLCFDLETQRLFQDVGGRHNVARLGVSLACVYSTRSRTFSTYYEADVEALAARLLGADLVVGFNLIHFDYEVLRGYVGTRIFGCNTVDMIVPVRGVLGFRVGLDALAKATMGAPKTANGLDAVRWFREGRLDLIEAYCRADVDITRRLFEVACREGGLRYPTKSGEVAEIALPLSALFETFVGTGGLKKGETGQRVG